MRRYLVLASFFLLTNNMFAQFDSLGIRTPWYKGSINLTNGNILHGYIQNNERLHLVRFKADQANDLDEHLVDEQDIVTMEYYDSRRTTLRRFANLNYKVKVEPTTFNDKLTYLNFKGEFLEGVVLFEIVMGYSRFVALSRVSKVGLAIRVEERNNGFDAVTKKVGIEYCEEFFFFDETGILHPVLITHHLERDKENFLYKKYKPFVDRSVLRDHMEPHWKEVEGYIKKNDLEIKTHADFLQILAYYKELEK
jgi:hypothetical protein